MILLLEASDRIDKSKSMYAVSSYETHNVLLRIANLIVVKNMKEFYILFDRRTGFVGKISTESLKDRISEYI